MPWPQLEGPPCGIRDCDRCQDQPRFTPRARVRERARREGGEQSGSQEREDTLSGLQSAHGFLQARLASELRLKRTPALEFIYDETTDRAMRVDALIEERRGMSDRPTDSTRGSWCWRGSVRTTVRAGHSRTPRWRRAGIADRDAGPAASLGKHSEMFIAPMTCRCRASTASSPSRPDHEPPADIAERTVVFLDCGNIDRNSARVLRDGATCSTSTIITTTRASAPSTTCSPRRPARRRSSGI